MAKARQMMRRLHDREQVLVGVAVVVAFLLLGDWMFLRPAIERHEELGLEAEIATREVALYRANLSQREDVEQAWDALRPRIAMAGSREVEMSAMLADIDQWQERSGSALVGTRMRDVEEQDRLNVFVLDADIEGTMTSIMHFLYLLQENDRLYRVRSFTLSPKSASGVDVLRAKMVITKVLSGE